MFNLHTHTHPGQQQIYCAEVRYRGRWVYVGKFEHNPDPDTVLADLRAQGITATVEGNTVRIIGAPKR